MRNLEEMLSSYEERFTTREEMFSNKRATNSLINAIVENYDATFHDAHIVEYLNEDDFDIYIRLLECIRDKKPMKDQESKGVLCTCEQLNWNLIFLEENEWLSDNFTLLFDGSAYCIKYRNLEKAKAEYIMDTA